MACQQPTYVGLVGTTQDALLLFEACLTGVLPCVTRRPKAREGLIQSGHIFVYYEESTGIRRWTDDKIWSPSRVLRNFLIYRELDKPLPSGRRRKSKTSKSSGITKQGSGFNNTQRAPTLNQLQLDSFSQELQQFLVGSLIASYGFKEGGLVKKTIAVEGESGLLCLVSYYTISDAMNNKFITPSKDEKFQYITPRLTITKHPFRSPIEGEVNPLILSGFGSNSSMVSAFQRSCISQRSTFCPILPRPSGSYNNSSIGTGPESYYGLATGNPNANRQQYPEGSEIAFSYPQHQFDTGPEAPLVWSSLEGGYHSREYRDDATDGRE